MPPDTPTPTSPEGRTTVLTHRRCCYVLFDDVDCNIARWGSEGEPGSWNYARGVLVETAQATSATPFALHHRELCTRHRDDPPSSPAHLPVGLEVTATLRCADDRLVRVVSHLETASEGGDTWCLTVDGHTLHHGRGARTPPRQTLGLLVRRHLLDQYGPRTVHPPGRIPAPGTDHRPTTPRRRRAP